MRSTILAISLLATSATFADDHGSAFEQPGVVAATEFVPSNLQTGPNHTVSSEANSDGYQNTRIMMFPPPPP